MQAEFSMKKENLKSLTILTLALSITLTIVSYYGAFVPGTYERDAASMAAQGMGQDIVDLFLVVPLLIISLIFMYKEKRAAFFLYSGTVFYILYSFFIYAFGVHFNNLFLLYCATLGLSLYAFIIINIKLSAMNIRDWFSDKMPVRSIGIFMIIVSVMFYMLWLKSIIPAIMTNTVPKDVSDYGLLVNPVHVLDLAIALPGLIIIAILFMKKHTIGFMFAPVVLIFVLILTVALIGMVILMKIKNISDDISLMYIFIVLALISGWFSFLFFKNLKSK
jgi:hypothetical protein